jgi:DNA invertase Pin-like site-specific DNA recombinase
MTTDKPVRAAIYARVSTDDQNCEMQLTDLREYCQRRGWEIVAEYVDTASGIKASRPQLDHLMHEAATRKFDAVLVWKLDRWARNLGNFVTSVSTLASLGVRWLSITQNLDTDQTNPMARFMIGILAVFAEFERDITRERCLAGIAQAPRSRVQLGRHLKVFDRDRARALKRAGSSVREIGRVLGVGKSTVARLLAA